MVQLLIAHLSRLQVVTNPSLVLATLLPTPATYFIFSDPMAITSFPPPPHFPTEKLSSIAPLVGTPTAVSSSTSLERGGDAIRSLKCSQNLEDFQCVDIVIEAIVGSESVKKKLFVICEELCNIGF
nr:3-hydroxyacyl-CoA dehydrogenase [Ipomoea batatas]